MNAMSREFVLRQIISRVEKQYDTILIDCMSALGMLTINALAASDEVLIPVETSYLPIKGLQQLLKTIGKVRRQINPKLEIGGIVFTMVDIHTNDARNNMELFHSTYGSQIHIFNQFVPFSVRMKEAVREEQKGIREVFLDSLYPFPNHPFKVLDDEKMDELAESIKQHGVLVPEIVLLKPSGGYELVSGQCH